mgnify:CR=1 FL=1
MPVDLRETRLPGVGVKYSFRIAQGGRLSVILHMDGQREIYYYEHDRDDEPTAVVELHADEARGDVPAGVRRESFARGAAGYICRAGGQAGSNHE